MRANLANLNHCAVTFLIHAAVGTILLLYYYYYYSLYPCITPRNFIFLRMTWFHPMYFDVLDHDVYTKPPLKLISRQVTTHKQYQRNNAKIPTSPNLSMLTFPHPNFVLLTDQAFSPRRITRQHLIPWLMLYLLLGTVLTGTKRTWNRTQNITLCSWGFLGQVIVVIVIF